jgi:hypothetical protein
VGLGGVVGGVGSAFCAFVLRGYMTKHWRDEPSWFLVGVVKERVKGEIPRAMSPPTGV